MFVARYSLNGDFDWVQQFGGVDSIRPWGMAVAANGDLMLNGNFWGSVDLDPGAGVQLATSAGGADIFILRLDSTGGLVWSSQLGTSI